MLTVHDGKFFILPQIGGPFPFNAALIPQALFSQRVRVAYTKLLSGKFFGDGRGQPGTYGQIFEALVSRQLESGAFEDDVFAYANAGHAVTPQELGAHGLWHTPIPQAAGLFDPAATIHDYIENGGNQQGYSGNSRLYKPPLKVWKSPSGRLYVECGQYRRWTKPPVASSVFKDEFSVFWEVTEAELLQNGEAFE